MLDERVKCTVGKTESSATLKSDVDAQSGKKIPNQPVIASPPALAIFFFSQLR
jgi:hypothetical protein